MPPAIPAHILRQLRRLKRAGVSQREAAKILGIGYNTARRNWNWGDAPGDVPEGSRDGEVQGSARPDGDGPDVED